MSDVPLYALPQRLYLSRNAKERLCALYGVASPGGVCLGAREAYRGTALIRKRPPLQDHHRFPGIEELQ